MPIMYVVAGPAGSGKTSAFPSDSFGCDYFNADHYAAMLNGGSYIGIPKSIRREVGPVCEKFIQDHITTGKDFATETTLRSTIVFDQMKQAHDAGFAVRFRYICVDSINTSVKRVKQRAFMGGHSASEETVQEIRSKSLANLQCAFGELGKTIDLFDLYDNSVFEMPPKLIASFLGREIIFLAAELPAWMDEALGQTPYATAKLREFFEQGKALPMDE
ncbi:MAG: zeta toxin family protein [Terracidiphilus sp.]